MLAAHGRVATREGTSTTLRYAQGALSVHLSDDVELLLDERQRRRRVEPVDGQITISPGQVLSVATEERFSLPDDVQGQVSPKASLTTIGLFFPTTHVDPGYDDRLYLPVFNAGPHTAELPVGEGIGKVELQRLPRAVAEPWRGRSGFRHARKDFITEGETPEQRVARLQSRIVLLQWVLCALLVVVVAMLVAHPVRGALDHVDWGILTTEGVKTYVAPIVVALVLALLTAVVAAATQGVRKFLRLMALKPVQRQRQD